MLCLLVGCLSFVHSSYSDSTRWGEVCEQVPDRADAYLLALTWQPGFCQTYSHGKKPLECDQLKREDFTSTHWTLHGLWPDQAACQRNYQFCGVSPRKSHCSYPALALAPVVADKLRLLMPSYEAGSCLERYEWNKHGSCQSRPVDLYFTVALRLVEEFNQTPLQAFIAKARGTFVAKKTLKEMLVTVFGEGAQSKIVFQCHSNILTGIYIRLPADIPENAPLAWLISQASHIQNRDTCPNKLMISDFHARLKQLE